MSMQEKRNTLTISMCPFSLCKIYHVDNPSIFSTTSEMRNTWSKYFNFCWDFFIRCLLGVEWGMALVELLHLIAASSLRVHITQGSAASKWCLPPCLKHTLCQSASYLTSAHGQAQVNSLSNVLTMTVGCSSPKWQIQSLYIMDV